MAKLVKIYKESNFRNELRHSFEIRFGRGKFIFEGLVASSAMAGLPDVFIAADMRFLFLELKVNDNKPTELQMHNLKKLNRIGVAACWIQRRHESIAQLFFSPNVYGDANSEFIRNPWDSVPIEKKNGVWDIDEIMKYASWSIRRYRLPKHIDDEISNYFIKKRQQG